MNGYFPSNTMGHEVKSFGVSFACALLHKNTLCQVLGAVKLIPSAHRLTKCFRHTKKHFFKHHHVTYLQFTRGPVAEDPAVAGRYWAGFLLGQLCGAWPSFPLGWHNDKSSPAHST